MTFRFKRLFEETRSRLRAHPGRRRVSIDVESRQVAGFRSEARVRDFTVTVDQPRAFGGEDSAPKPTEYVLAALAACQEVTYRLYADALEIPIDDVRVSITGWSDPHGFLGLDDAARPGLQEVKGTVFLTSSAEPEAIARLQEAVERHCPVLDDLRSPVAVTMTVETRSTVRPEE